MTVQGHGWDDTVGYPAYRNVLINGAMQVAQRGLSTAGITTGGFYAADRWQHSMSGLGTWTDSVENDAPTGSGFRNSYKTLCTTAKASPAAGDYYCFAQNLEGLNLQHFAKGTTNAKKFALQFWVKSNVTGTYVVELNDTDNNRLCASTYTITSSGTWEKKTIIFPADTTGIFVNDNNRSLELNFWLGAGSNWTSGTLNTTWASYVQANRVVGGTNLAASVNNYWQITGIQLEPNNVNTPFEFEPFDTTLRRCQRYYQIVIDNSTNYYQCVGSQYSSTTAFNRYFFPVTMRDTPAIVDNAIRVGIYSAGGAVTSSASIATPYPDRQGIGIGWGTPAATTGRAVHMDWASGSLHVTAEL